MKKMQKCETLLLVSSFSVSLIYDLVDNNASSSLSFSQNNAEQGAKGCKKDRSSRKNTCYCRDVFPPCC